MIVMLIKTPVLVLNASYEPIAICAARRALSLYLKGAAIVEENYDVFIRHDMPLPSVIRLRCYKKVPRPRVDATRKGILARDFYTCQYCGEVLPNGKLTLDHVFPRSRGGKGTWDNLVACCYPCNNFKDNKTPEEANMVLLRTPRSSSVHTARNLIRSQGLSNDKWAKYVFN